MHTENPASTGVAGINGPPTRDSEHDDPEIRGGVPRIY